MPHPFINHLKEDHKKQRSLGKRLTEAAEGKRSSLSKVMWDETYPHMEGEEASIFAFMRAAGDEEAKEHALEAIQEHHVGKLVMRELLALSPSSEVFKAKATVLDEMNRTHMEEEETTHFPWLEAHASKEQLDGLYKDYEKAEAAAKKS